MPNQDEFQNDPEDDVQQFLNRIGQLESSGGQNFNHQPMQTGIQSGTTAMGTYGLMPNTVQEIIHRAPTSELNSIAALSPDQMKQTIESDPELEQNIAHLLAQRVLRNQGDDEKAAYAWHMGHNLTPEQVEERGYQDNPYVREYRKIKQSLGNK